MFAVAGFPEGQAGQQQQQQANRQQQVAESKNIIGQAG